MTGYGRIAFVVVLAIGAAYAVAVWLRRAGIFDVGVLWEESIRASVYSPNGEMASEPALLIVDPVSDEVVFTSDGHRFVDIPRNAAGSGRQMVVTALGCGVLRAEVEAVSRIDLPPALPIVVAMESLKGKVPAGYGIQLHFRALNVDSGLGALLGRSVVQASYWDWNPAERDHRIWLDLDSGTVSVLLPCPGSWAVEWEYTLRDSGEERGGLRPISVVLATGEFRQVIGSKNELISLPVTLDDLNR